MTVIQFLVTDQVLSVTEKPVIASGDINTVKAVFDFEGEFWQNCTKQASFWNEKTPDEIIPVIFTEDECIVPASVLAKEGYFYIGVMGIKELDVIKTSTVVKYQIKKGAPYGSGTVVDDPPTAWEQALAIVGECNETARKAERIATTALEACGSAYVEDNTLHIESVGAGEVGVDGIGIVGMEYSQSLEDAGLNTLTIKLSDGTSQSFYVKNGSKGSQGIQGKTGASVTDVYTEDYVWNNGETGMRVGFAYPRSDGGISTTYGYVKNGKSAFQYAQDAGYTGTETEFATKLAEDAADVTGIYYVTLTDTDLLQGGEFTCDKTFTEINAAYNAGQFLVAKIVSNANTPEEYYTIPLAQVFEGYMFTFEGVAGGYYIVATMFGGSSISVTFTQLATQ